MTWLRRARFAVTPWLIVALGLAASACSVLPSASTPSHALLGEHCADLLAAALSSPDAPVAGAFDCQAPALASNAQGSGINTDADIEGVAKALGFTSSAYIGAQPGVFTFLMTGPSISPAVLVVWTDSSGLVAGFDRAMRP